MAHCTCTASWNVAGGSLDLSSVLSYAWKGSDESESSEDCSKDEDLDGTSPPQPLILQPPDLDTPTSCEVHIACREHTAAEIVGLAVVSSAHHIEIFTKDGYQATGRGEVVCKPGNGSSCQQTMYHADLDLTYPVTDLSIRFVTLADRSCLVVYIIEVLLSPCKPAVPGRVDHRKVHQMLGESGVELSDGAKNLMRLVESQQQNKGNAMGQQTSNMTALLPLLGMFTGAMGGQPPPPKHPAQTTSQVPPASSSRTPVSSNTDIQDGDFSNMLQKLTLSDQAGASGLNGDLMLSVLQNVCKDVGQNRQTSTGAEGRQVLTQKKETSRVDGMDVGGRETSCRDEQGKGQVEEEINDNPRFVTDHEMSDMENRIMGNLSSMEERIMGRVDDQLQGMQSRIESKLDAVLNAMLSKKDDS
ncbi:C10orf88 [Branchiostoma lanceolatum]|uniref:C10orf88 protein n=2 Tax=Branchiostoma lanceolatum TaxID=7740 RepID=A0A8J9ZNK5_BRALA|nr:C10orf88 [Branchiostoma lanceolatum]